MSCCGQKRQEFSGQSSWQVRPSGAATLGAAAFAGPVPAQPAPQPVPMGNPAMGSQSPISGFGPAGNQGLTATLKSLHGSTAVTGRVTGKRYRFEGPGSMVAVDHRDADGLLATGAFERVWG